MRGKQAMRFIKKCIYAFPVSLLLIVCLSLSAFALDAPKDSYDFTLQSYPIHTLDNSNNVQSFSYFIQNTDYEVLYCEVIINKNSGSRPINFTNCYITAGSLPVSDYYRFVPMAWLTQAFGGYSFELPTKMYFYDESGTLVQQFSFGIGGSASVGLRYNTNWFNNGVSIDRFSLMSDGLRFYAFPYPSTYAEANTQIMSNWVTGYPDYLLGGFNVVSPDEQFDSTIEGNITVNGNLVYGSGGGSDGNLASKIIGSAIGNISFPDGNGGTVDGDVNVSVDLDIPDKEFNNGITYPDMSDINDTINDNMTELDIMDTSTDAFDFIYTKINEIAHANSKILIMFTSCLSAGVIMIILNKRGV